MFQIGLQRPKLISDLYNSAREFKITVGIDSPVRKELVGHCFPLVIIEYGTIIEGVPLQIPIVPILGLLPDTPRVHHAEFQYIRMSR